MDKKKLIIVISSLLITSITIGIIAFATGTNKSSGGSKDDEPEDVVTTTYTVSFDTQGGTPIADITVNEGDKITKPEDPIKRGYHVDEWLYEDKPWLFDSYTVKSDMTLKTTWDYDTYTIEYRFLGGEAPTETYPTSYNINSEFELIRPVKFANIFAGWFSQDGNRVDSIKKGMTGNLVLTARWIDGLIINSEDESKGTIYVYGDEEDINKVTVKNIPTDKKYHLFTGWYDNEDNLLSEDTEYTFTLKDDITYINSHYMNDEEEHEWNLEHGVVPSIYGDSNKYVKYGMYPQSNVNDEDLINKLNSSELTTIDGYYYYNHEYYAKRKAKIAKDMETGETLPLRNFDNGDEIIEDNEYWFKVEPLSWRVLENEDSSYFLLSEKLIEVRRYHFGGPREIDGKTIMPNNYKYSEVRSWLNDSFYNNTFVFNKENIQTMEVDNSASSTATPESGFECENTFDKVTLLSYKDYSDSKYGFPGANATPARRFLTTDYARANAAQYSTDVDKPHTGYCWTRSPIETDENNGSCASRNNKNGTLNNDYVGFNGSCVQPALTISYNL